MIVSPLGKIHLCAELGGNVMTAEGSVGAAFRLTIINNRTAEKNFASGMRAIEVAAASPVISRRLSLSRRSRLRRGQFRLCPRHRWFFRRERLHENLFEIINVPEIFDRILLGFPEYHGANHVKKHVSDVLGWVKAQTIENP